MGQVDAGPREQLSRQFYSTPPTTRAAIDDISTLLQKMSGILFVYGFALALNFFFISSNILPQILPLDVDKYWGNEECGKISH